MKLITRDELYDLVWSVPMLELAKRFGMSDVGMARKCKRVDIPVPPRGYWAKLDAGHQVERPPLPTGGPRVVDFVGLQTNSPGAEILLNSAELRTDTLAPSEPVLAAEPTERSASLRSRLRKVAIPPLSRNTHPAVQALLERDQRTLELRCEGSFSFEPLSFDTRDAKRRLRLVNAMFLAFEHLGARPNIENKRATELSVRASGANVPFQLVEGGRSPRGSSPRQTPPLKLRVGSPNRWREQLGYWDERKVRLDDQLSDVVVGLLVAGEHFRREAEAAQQREELKHLRRLEEQAERKRQEAEKTRRAALADDAHNHRLARDIRALVAAARLTGFAPPSCENLSLKEWSAWALVVATTSIR